MKKTTNTLILSISLSLILTSFLFAQKQENNWIFGNYAGITFNTNPPTSLLGGQINTTEGCSSISDTSGNLLFYSNGSTVWDRNHAIMQNGTGLLGNGYSTQSATIFQAPGSSTLYYIVTSPLNTSSNPLAYSIVDMSMNGGLGAITIKNDTLLAVSTEKVTLVRHPNGTDLWIIAHSDLNNFAAFLCTSQGINSMPVTSSTGNSILDLNNKIGYLKASPCGNQLAMADYNTASGTTTIELFNFDNTTGIVSNGLTLHTFITTTERGFYGIEFSPDNSKLYTSFTKPGLILQYDLLAGSPSSIIASEDTIGISTAYQFGALQSGPDGKIYIAKSSDSSLACIANPNGLGNLCNFILNDIYLGGNIAVLGLPNFLSIPYCVIQTNSDITKDQSLISIYPNPFNSIFTISIGKQNTKNITIEIYDVLGQRVFISNENTIGGTIEKTINLSTLSNQIYFININIDGMQYVKKIIKE